MPTRIPLRPSMLTRRRQSVKWIVLHHTAEMYENPEKTIFPIYKGLIHSYLQLIWDAEENVIYDDCAVNAYGPNKEFIPLHEDINFNLYPNSEITIVVHAD